MRAAIAVVALLSASSGAIALACGSDTPATAVPADGGNRRESSGESGRTSDSGDTSADAAIVISPDGCPLTSTGYTSGSKAENVARTDVTNTAEWTDVANALEEDGMFASVTLGEGQESATLRVSDFKLAVPNDKETWGMEVELKRRAVDGGIEDSRIDVEIEGKTSTFKYVNGPWPTTILGTHHYGQAIDTWGVDLFPADVNKPNFAAKISVKRAEGVTGPVIAVVESVKVAVHYCK